MFVLMILSCSPIGKMRRIRSGEVAMTLSVSEEEPLDEEEDNEVVRDKQNRVGCKATKRTKDT